MPVATPVVTAIAPPVVPPAPLQLDWSSGLTQIETAKEKVQAVQAAAPVSEAPRVRRARPVPPPVIEEPLMQVETGRSTPPAQNPPA
jgi:hypothetical protein